mmetsp:Transcript_30951/g.99856  ORF Transcript_30951/g.99856 Transcript_30951/m.99856 type:complete len:338 (-) Transcript_30951:331-1344(-)
MEKKCLFVVVRGPRARKKGRRAKKKKGKKVRYPPFNANSDVAIFERVKKGLTTKSFPAEDWDDISPDAKAFITNLLDLDAMKRMTAAEALKHPWIEKQRVVGESADSPPPRVTYSELAAAPLQEQQQPPPQMPQKKDSASTGKGGSPPPPQKRGSTTAKPPPTTKKRINGDQLANRLQNFVGMSKLKKVALNVLAHHLTEKEIAELSLIWKQIDVDGSGTITVAELRNALVQNGHNATEGEMRDFLEGMDTDGNKEIDYYEFAAALLARNQTIRDDRVKEIFEQLDSHHNGYITVDDLVEIMGSREHATEVLGDDFPDAEQKIDFATFKAKLQSASL